MDHSPTGLLSLPTEILLEIGSLLNTRELRLLGRANRGLHVFIGDYLARYRYNVGLFTLPIELILEIVQHLSCRKDQSRLARASQRFYPLVMDDMIRWDVRYNGSSLLNAAAKGSLRRITREILRLGGDVNTRCGPRARAEDRRPTPLMTAVCYGHEKIVSMLLEAGASHFVDGMRIPLAVAIRKRHENVALMLLQEMGSIDMPLVKAGETALQLACIAKLVTLVRYCLEHGSRCGEHVTLHAHHDRSIALCRLLKKDAKKSGSVRREKHENVYRIVLSLLQHGTNPDTRVKISEYSQPITARDIASRHPDPRVRNLLSKETPAMEPKKTALPIEQP